MEMLQIQIVLLWFAILTLVMQSICADECGTDKSTCFVGMIYLEVVGIIYIDLIAGEIVVVALDSL